jgi:hypothetical protein
MFTNLDVTRVSWLALSCALFLVALPAAAQTSAEVPVILDEITDEWENEIIKLRIADPGVLVTGLVTIGDQDLFNLILDTAQTVVVEADGDDLEGSLLNENGTALATAVGDPGTGFRIVLSLAPGQYRLRVTGGQGSYRVLAIANQ